MANPLDILNGEPVIINKNMVNAFNDIKLEVEGVDGLVTLWDLLAYLGQNVNPGTLAGLSDVDFKSPPANGETLTYNAGDGVWENTAP